MTSLILFVSWIVVSVIAGFYYDNSSMWEVVSADSGKAVNMQFHSMSNCNQDYDCKAIISDTSGVVYVYRDKEVKNPTIVTLKRTQGIHRAVWILDKPFYRKQITAVVDYSSEKQFYKWNDIL
jgi:hypothetical protein